MLDKFFNFVFSLPVIKKFRPFYEKRKDIVLYIFFGILTTLVSFISFWLSEVLLGELYLHLIISNTISWVLAVAFAFFTNRQWVFKSPTKTFYAFLRQLLLFYTGRLLSFFVETGIIWAFASVLGLNSLLIKIAASVIVLILNYIISKLFVFRKSKFSSEVGYDKATD